MILDEKYIDIKTIDFIACLGDESAKKESFTHVRFSCYRVTYQ